MGLFNPMTESEKLTLTAEFLKYINRHFDGVNTIKGLLTSSITTFDGKYINFSVRHRIVSAMNSWLHYTKLQQSVWIYNPMGRSGESWQTDQYYVFFNLMPQK